MVGGVIGDRDVAARRDLGELVVGLGVQPERDDVGGLQRDEAVVVLDVVVGEEEDVLEVVEIQLFLRQCPVGLIVVVEGDGLDVDALLGGLLLVDGPE